PVSGGRLALEREETVDDGLLEPDDERVPGDADARTARARELHLDDARVARAVGLHAERHAAELRLEVVEQTERVATGAGFDREGDTRRVAEHQHPARGALAEARRDLTVEVDADRAAAADEARVDPAPERPRRQPLVVEREREDPETRPGQLLQQAPDRLRPRDREHAVRAVVLVD